MSFKIKRLIEKSGQKGLTRAEQIALREPLDYSDGRTQQAFKDETDINRIMQRAQVTGTISHLAKHQARYADFSDFDFVENERKLVEAREMFDGLPAEIRKEFNQRPQEFFEFVTNPENAERLPELLPALAKPGRQNVPVDRQRAPAPSGAPNPTPEAPTEPPPPEPAPEL